MHPNVGYTIESQYNFLLVC